jgi:malate/lactate dehydrogenase
MLKSIVNFTIGAVVITSEAAKKVYEEKARPVIETAITRGEEVVSKKEKAAYAKGANDAAEMILQVLKDKGITISK